jgi:hypothetical protein
MAQGPINPTVLSLFILFFVIPELQIVDRYH